LQQAFTCYYQAFFEGDAHKRAERLLFANIAIGLHEQTRLQPEIAEALDAALVDVKVLRAQLIRALFPFRGWWVRLRLFLLRVLDRPSPLEAVLQALSAEMRPHIHRVITEYLMTIELPHDVRLRLGSDLPGEFLLTSDRRCQNCAALLEQTIRRRIAPETGAADRIWPSGCISFSICSARQNRAIYSSLHLRPITAALKTRRLRKFCAWLRSCVPHWYYLPPTC
jgi:hypothetical protein